MGQLGGKPSTWEPPKGCFWSHNSQKETAGMIWSLMWDLNRVSDCDCRVTKACPHGPPPIPPLREFIDPSSQIDLYLQKMRPAHLPNKPGDPVWVDTSEEIDDSGQTTGQRHPRDMRLGERDTVAIPALSQYWVDMANTYAALPQKKKHALSAFIDATGPSDVQLSVDSLMHGEHMSAEIHPVWVLAIMLAGPQEAKKAVMSMPIDGVRNLVHCTQLAINAAIDETRKLDGASEPLTFTHGQRYVRGKVEAEASLHQLIRRTSTSWQRNLPDDLRLRNASEAFTQEEADQEHRVFDQICDEVYPYALSAVDQRKGAGFVADWDHVWAALDSYMWEESKPHLSFGAAVAERMAENSEALGIKFTSETAHYRPVHWEGKHVRWVTGPAYPAFVVAMDYLALSLSSAPAGIS